MPKSSLFWASTHPCYDLQTGKYICECGNISDSVTEHDRHVQTKHITDREVVSRIVSWKTYIKWFGEE